MIATDTAVVRKVINSPCLSKKQSVIQTHHERAPVPRQPTCQLQQAVQQRVAPLQQVVYTSASIGV